MNESEQLGQERDNLVDALLREELAGEQPPDLLARILARSPFGRRAKVIAWASLTAAAAATLAIVAALWALSGGGYPQPRITGQYQVASGGSFARGSVVNTQDQPAQITLGGYVTLRLAPKSELRVDGAPRAEEVYLATGQLDCAVTPDEGEFAVRTDAGSVRVTGTQFIVRVFEEKGVDKMFAKRTFVRVLAGTVLVSGLWGSVSFAAGQEGTVPPARPKAEAAEPVGERKTGEIRGVVVKVEQVRAEEVLRLALTITTEGGVQEAYIVGPGNAQAYALAGSLKTGERVRIEWVTEGNTTRWIRSIRRLEGDGGRTGELNGVVVGVEAVRAEGVLRLALTTTTEGGVRETYIVGPANAQAYALVGSLRTGERVRLAWVTEGDATKWIRGIRRLESAQGDRAATERKEEKPREPDTPRERRAEPRK